MVSLYYVIEIQTTLYNLLYFVGGCGCWIVLSNVDKCMNVDNHGLTPSFLSSTHLAHPIRTLWSSPHLTPSFRSSLHLTPTFKNLLHLTSPLQSLYHITHLTWIFQSSFHLTHPTPTFQSSSHPTHLTWTFRSLFHPTSTLLSSLYLTFSLTVPRPLHSNLQSLLGITNNLWTPIRFFLMHLMVMNSKPVWMVEWMHESISPNSVIFCFYKKYISHVASPVRWGSL